MKNTHLEHPEDTILTGDLSVLNWFTQESYISVKIDGAPALVWGTDPATGTFFVGTKSVFNKKKIKINHSHEEIDVNHEGQVADILHIAFDSLPRTKNIIQGDFIGFGGENVYQPNVVTYVFDDVIYEDIIIAPHTIYSATHDLRDAEARPLMTKLISTDTCKFVQPEGFCKYEDAEEVVAFARQMSTIVDFATPKEAAELKKQINTAIRLGNEVNEDDFDCDPNLIRMWSLVKSIKDDMLYLCGNNGPRSFIKLDEIDAEGYVAHNEHGSYKLVDREIFSHANFNFGRFQRAS